MVYYPNSPDYTSSPSSDMSYYDYSQEYPRMPQQQPQSSRSFGSYPSSYGGYPMSATTSSSSQYSSQYSPTTTQSSLYTWDEGSDDYSYEDQCQRGSDARGSVSGGAPLRPEYFCLVNPCRYSCARKADLERHVFLTHNRSSADLVDCDVPGCHRKGLYGFTRKDKMRDHKREVHKVDIPKRASGKRDSVTGYERR